MTTDYSIVKSNMKNFNKVVKGIMGGLVQESTESSQKFDKEPAVLPEHIKVFREYIGKPKSGRGFQEYDFDVKKLADEKYTFIMREWENPVSKAMRKENKVFSNMESLEALLREIFLPEYTRRIYVEDDNGNLIYQTKL